jgi:hypothetical protein
LRCMRLSTPRISWSNSVDRFSAVSPALIEQAVEAQQLHKARSRRRPC